MNRTKNSKGLAIEHGLYPVILVLLIAALIIAIFVFYVYRSVLPGQNIINGIWDGIMNG